MAKRSDETLYELPETKLVPNKKNKSELDTLLREAHSLKGAEARLKTIKSRISEIVQEQASELSVGTTLGARFGKLCTIVRWQNGRATLSREKLVDNGVTMEQLEASTVTGAGSWVVELPEITE